MSLKVTAFPDGPYEVILLPGGRTYIKPPQEDIERILEEMRFLQQQLKPEEGKMPEKTGDPFRDALVDQWVEHGKVLHDYATGIMTQAIQKTDAATARSLPITTPQQDAPEYPFEHKF